MRVLYGEGVANHTSPESCVLGREAGIEALTGEHVGRVLSRERINRDADAVLTAEGHARRRDSASVSSARAVRDPSMHARASFGNREIFGSAAPSGPYREGDKPEPMMHDPKKSDLPIVASKPANAAALAGAELAERRGRAKENASQHGTCRTPSRESMSSGLERVRKTAKLRKKERFTALLHHVTTELLRDAYSWLKRDAAVGVDGVTWDEGLISRLISPICTPAFIAALTGRNRHGGCTFPNRTDGGVHSALPRWKIRSSSARSPNCSTRSTRNISSGSRTPSGQDAASMMRWMRSRSGSGAER